MQPNLHKMNSLQIGESSATKYTKISLLPLSRADLRHPPGPSSHSVASLTVAADRPDWSNLDDIDVPLRQLSLSHAINEASHQHLLSSAPDTRSRALALSSGLR